ncbi:MAG: hypothetical protein ACXVCY_03515 [Pseudobdellovibrionaceae bacterium]
MIKVLLGLICALSCNFGLAQTHTSKLKPLFFQADKNGVQVLPQRFEYSLLDEDRLKVGDILIDTTQVTFKIEPSTEKTGTYRIQFSWPAGLINEGQLAIKNSSGKAIFNKVVTKNVLKISPGATQDTQEGLRSSVATLAVDGIESTLIEDMKYYPFITFCVYRESDETKLYLCSKELYLTAQNGTLTIKQRSSTKKTAQIDINGEVVGNQGIIYLNDRSETVAFKMETQTGAFLEIETRRKDVDFKDVILADNNENIILTASGAEPVDESKVKKISETEWQITLPKERPVIYLKGDGDIPMRQEFYIRGILPQPKFRPYVSAKSISRTYSSTAIINGISPQGVGLKIPENDKDSAIEISKKNNFTWSLRNIPSGQNVRRYLNANADNHDFLVGYDIFRGQPFNLELRGYFQSPAGIAYGELNFQWWFENVLSMNSPQSRFHWGISLDREQHLSEKPEVAKVNLNTLEVLWRAHEGFDLVDETWGISLPMQMIQGDSANTVAYGVGAFLSKRNSHWLKYLGQWTQFKAQYFVGSLSGDLKLKSALRLKALAYRQLNNQWFLSCDLNFDDYKFDPASPKEQSQLGVGLGLLYKF